MSYKTTGKDFTEFKAECQRWVDYFGLKDWEICYDKEDSEDNRASCLSDYPGKIAVLSLSNEWPSPPQKNEIKQVAFHEVSELLIAPLRAMAVARYVTEDEILVANHYIIRVLENTTFKEKTK
jgi:hypothetical protein